TRVRIIRIPGRVAGAHALPAANGAEAERGIPMSRKTDVSGREEAGGELLPGTTRRAFVRAAVHTLAGVAVLAACGDAGDGAAAARPGGAGGGGGAGGSGG